MNHLWSVLARADRPAFAAWIGLMILGLATVYSCTVDFQSSEEIVHSTVGRSVFYSQLTWAAVGLGLAFLCILIPFRYFETFAYLGYGVAVLALLAVFALGPQIQGSRRWLSLGGLTVQPSEFAKVALIFALGRFLAGRSDRKPLLLVLGVGLLVMPIFLLVYREPDLGTSLVFPALAIPMLFWAGVRASFLIALASPLLGAAVMFYGQQVLDSTWPWVLYIVGLLLVLYSSRLYVAQSTVLVLANVATGLGIPLVWERLKPYQQARILSFFDPSDTDRLGYGYQTFQSKVAIGSGGLLGKGYLEGSQKGLAFLPARHTDFIFSVVGEELGLLGALVVLSLFLVLIARSLTIAVTVKRPFGSALAVGVASYFCFQAVVNVSITLGLLPVTGLPLPLLSYGGSSMLVSCIMMGLLLNVSARWHEV